MSGAFVDGLGAEGAAEGAVHDVIALGAVFAVDVLHDADIAAGDDDVGGVVIALMEHGGGVRALGVGW